MPKNNEKNSTPAEEPQAPANSGADAAEAGGNAGNGTTDVNSGNATEGQSGGDAGNATEGQSGGNAGNATEGQSGGQSGNATGGQSGGESGKATGGESGGNSGKGTEAQSGGNSIKDTANDIIDITAKAAETYNKMKATVTLEKVTADTAFVNEAVSAWEKVSFDKLIGEPLKAAIKAQGDAAKSTLEFIRNVGVTSDSDNGSETLTVVSFNFFKNGKIAKLQIPLMTLVPIPALCITEVTYDFKMTISSSSDVTMKNTNTISNDFKVTDTPGQQTVGSNSSNNSTKSKDDGKEKQEKSKAQTTAAEASKVKDATNKSFTFTANYSSKKDSTATQISKYSVETTMDVKLKVSKDDLPAGVSKMLEVLNDSTEIYDPNGELTLSSDNLTLSDGYAILSVIYKDGNGNYDTSAIKCTDMENKEKGQKAASSDSLQIVFADPGVYKISAGKKCQLVQVNSAVSTTTES